MNKTPFLIFSAFAVVCVLFVAKVVAGSGSESAAPARVAAHDRDEKALFANNCGPCHTLAAAGADGVVGPNLDQVLAPGGQATYEGSYQRTLSAVTCGFGGGRMPAGILQGENAMDVSAFVAAYAGQSGSDLEPLEDTREAPQSPPPDDCASSGEE